MDLPEGQHEYKFLVDGEWKVSTEEAACNNNIGTKNNIITIKDQDLEEFENALLRDPNDKNKLESSGKSSQKEKGEGEDSDVCFFFSPVFFFFFFF